jgi:hypothetical protein
MSSIIEQQIAELKAELARRRKTLTSGGPMLGSTS